MKCGSHGVCMCRQAQAHADMLQGKQPIPPADSTVTSAAAATAAMGSQQTGKEPSSGKRPGKLLILPGSSGAQASLLVYLAQSGSSCRVLGRELPLPWKACL